MSILKKQGCTTFHLLTTTNKHEYVYVVVVAEAEFIIKSCGPFFPSVLCIVFSALQITALTEIKSQGDSCHLLISLLFKLLVFSDSRVLPTS